MIRIRRELDSTQSNTRQTGTETTTSVIKCAILLPDFDPIDTRSVLEFMCPAAGLVDLFEGENLVLINKTPTPKDGLATLAIYGDVAEVAKRIEVSK